MPFLRVLVLVLAFMNATGLGDALVELACADACADEADCQDCPPACPSCHGTARPAVTLAASAAAPTAPPRAPALRVLLDHDRAPTAPDPHEILRVPIARAG